MLFPTSRLCKLITKINNVACTTTSLKLIAPTHWRNLATLLKKHTGGYMALLEEDGMENVQPVICGLWSTQPMNQCSCSITRT